MNKLYAPATGGIETVVRQISEGLKDVMQIKVLVCQDKINQTIEECIFGVNVRRCASRWKVNSMPLSLQFLRDYKKLSKQVDIVQVHMPFPLADLAYLLAGKSKKNLVIWWHSDIVRQKRWMLFYRPLCSFFLKQAQAIIVATKEQIDNSDILWKYKDRCIVIPYGIKKEVLYATKSYKEERNAHPLRVLFVGRLVYYKGCEILLEALAKTKEIILTIVGEGPLKASLQKQTKRLHLENRVFFLGQMEDERLFQEYASCDVFVLPSVVKSEAFGLVQLEAMAFGKPVINTSLQSGVPYVSLDGKTGLTVPPQNTVALTKALNWMKNHPQQRLAMGREAKRRIETKFREEEMLYRIKKLYEEITIRNNKR